MFIKKINHDLALKMLAYTDDEKLFELTDRSRDYLNEWLPWLDGTLTPADSLSFIKGSLKDYAENKSLTTAIMYQDQLAGIAGFNTINWQNKTAYIGYWLGQDYQGQGIMTEVARALTNYAFADLNLNKVEIRAALGNHKSRKIPERLNFTNEGCLRQAEWLTDHYVDHVVYGMLKTEWQDTEA